MLLKYECKHVTAIDKSSIQDIVKYQTCLHVGVPVSPLSVLSSDDGEELVVNIEEQKY